MITPSEEDLWPLGNQLKLKMVHWKKKPGVPQNNRSLDLVTLLARARYQ